LKRTYLEIGRLLCVLRFVCRFKALWQTMPILSPSKLLEDCSFC